MDEPLQELPLATASFTKLRKRNQIYVDKTDLLFQLTKSSGKYFLARPRRFGKSLLISTFQSLFQDGLKYFKGLAIEKLWKDDKRYLTITLDLSEIRDVSIEEFDCYFSSLIVSTFLPFGFQYNKNLSTPLMEQLSKWFKNQEKDSVVLLIDEYDAPLTEYIDDPLNFNFISKNLSSFYSIIKENERRFRFLFITGITKFIDIGLFSSPDNIQDISLSSLFSNITGFSQLEIQKYFTNYIKRSAHILKRDDKQLFNNLSKNYNGFCFCLNPKDTVFSPWSMLNFFFDPAMGFEKYWFNSGGQPEVLQKYFRGDGIDELFQTKKKLTLPLNLLAEPSNFKSLDKKVLLTQTGYLTIKDYDPLKGIITLGFPNAEVEKSMSLLCLMQILKGKLLSEVGASGILKDLSKENLESLIKKINNALLSINYQDYPLINEYRVQTAIMLILQGAGIEVQVERRNAKGRSDLEFSIGPVHWVVELKFSKDPSCVDSLLEKGEKQMVAHQHGKQSFSKSLKRVVLVYSAEDRKIIRYSWCSG